MNIERLKTAASLLVSFAQKVGVSPAVLDNSEAVDGINVYIENARADCLRTLSLPDLDELVGAFEDSLRFIVRIGEYELLNVCGTCDPVEFGSFHQEIQKTNSVILDLALDKRRLREICGIDEDGQRVCVFFNSARLVRLLKNALSDPTQIESLLWNDSLKKAVVLLLDQDARLVGPFLVVLGASSIAEVETIERTPDQELKNAARVHAGCRANARWERRFTSFIVPRCLRIDGAVSLSDPVAKAILAHWANLSVLFTADRVQASDTQLLATYATERMRSEVELLSDSDSASFAFCNAAPALGDIAEWAYDEHWGSDRLRMAQIGIARAMAYGEQPKTCLSLAVQSPGILEELEWRWKTFICDEIERFSEEERKLEHEVAETVRAFDGEITEMIKSLSATVLAAVGVLIGSVIAAAFKGDFNATVFSLGILAYVAYLVVFPGIYGMTHHVLRFHTCDRLFSNRRRRFERVLAPDVVEETIGRQVSDAKKRFWWWFSFTILAFIVVIIACLVADSRVPALLSKGTKTLTTPAAAQPASSSAQPAAGVPSPRKPVPSYSP